MDRRKLLPDNPAMLSAKNLHRVMHMNAQYGDRSREPSSVLRDRSDEGPAEELAAGDIQGNPLASKLDPKVVLQYKAQMVLDAQRSALLEGMLAVLQNLNATKAVAEKLGITVEACQDLYRESVRLLFEDDVVPEGSVRCILAHVPSPDGTDVRLEQLA
jgi:hypothetical protein